MTDEIPERLRRNAQNVAPFMELTPWQQKRREQNSDEWGPEPPLVIGLDGQMSVGGQKVVGVVVDDAWLAPWASEPNPSATFKSCENIGLWGQIRTCESVPCDCLEARGVAGRINYPSDNPQATSQDWVPPWASKS